MIIRSCNTKDAESVCDIYNHYIETSVATFEEDCLQAIDMEQRIKANFDNYPWLVCEDQDQIVGYAYASLWKQRSAYKNSVESTVYIKQGFHGKGYGSVLYQSLLDELKLTDLHTVVAGITLPNEASVLLHERLGFEKSAHFKQVGRKFDQWLDVGYWQLMLNQWSMKQ